MFDNDYLFAWIIYILAAVPVSWMVWRVLRRFLWRELAYLLQSFFIAIVFTPWYVLPEEDILAPAVIVFIMDAITIDMEDSIRALIPIVMAMLLGIMVTLVLSVIYRMKLRKGASNKV